MVIAQCAHPGCVSLADAGEQCQRHLMEGRRRIGLCANCGGERVRLPVMNALTGRQQLRYGRPVWVMRCLECGREQRPFAGEA